MFTVCKLTARQSSPSKFYFRTRIVMQQLPHNSVQVFNIYLETSYNNKKWRNICLNANMQVLKKIAWSEDYSRSSSNQLKRVINKIQLMKTMSKINKLVKSSTLKFSKTGIKLFCIIWGPCGYALVACCIA